MILFMFGEAKLLGCCEWAQLDSAKRIGSFVPQCTDDCEYLPKQCHGSIGFCWCVDEDGMRTGDVFRSAAWKTCV